MRRLGVGIFLLLRGVLGWLVDKRWCGGKEERGCLAILMAWFLERVDDRL